MIPSWLARAVRAGFKTPKTPTLEEALAFMQEAVEEEKPRPRPRAKRKHRKPFKQVVLDVGGLPPILPPDLSTEPARNDN